MVFTNLPPAAANNAWQYASKMRRLLKFGADSRIWSGAVVGTRGIL
jgi:hypothetical protein